MTFKELILSRLQLFFFLVSAILLTQIILGNAIEPDKVLHYKDLVGTFEMAGLCILPTFLVFSKKEPTLKQILVKEAIQLVLIEGIMFTVSIIGIESSPKKAFSVTMICVSVVVIYVLSVLLIWYCQNLESKKLTGFLKEFQNNQRNQENKCQ